MNIAICHQSLDFFSSAEDLKAFYEDCGLTGLEVIRAWETDQGKILPWMVHGVHLFFHVFWMDWWKGNYSRLDQEFDSREQWLEYFGGTEKEAYLKNLREDLDYAEKIGAKYVVFHVSESTMEECFSYKFRYTDEEVIDASLEVLQALLGEKEYPFDFLVENLWWSGLTLNNVSLAKKLLYGIPAARKGFLLDTGHYMNTDPNLSSPEEAVAYLSRMISIYEKEGLLPYFKGMHLHMSLSGEYKRAAKKDPRYQPEQIARLPFYEKYRVVTEHTRNLDTHLPFLGKGVRELIQKIAPDYLTYEFQPKDYETYREMAKKQSRELGIL